VVGGPPRKAVPTKADPGTLAAESGHYSSEKECNPGTDLKVRHYKNNPKKKHIDRGWILEMGR